MLNKKLTIHWLGEDIEQLDEIKRRFILEHFLLQRSSKDVSLLTLPRLKIVLFFAAKPRLKQLECALKICQNLNKSIIVLYDHAIDRHFIEHPVVLRHIDLRQTNTDELEQLHLFLIQHLAGDDHHDELQQKIEQLQETNNDFGRKLYQCLHHIDEHLMKPIKEEDLAELCHCSVSYFSHQFQQYLAMNFRDYLTMKRIEEAKSILESQPKEKIASIAYQCGYNDVAYFTRIFKKKVGYTPSVYRQKAICFNE